MATITQNVVSITPPAPPAAGKKAGPYKVRLGDGIDYDTFDQKLLADLKPGMCIEAEVSEKQNGQYLNHYLGSWTLSMAKAPEGAAPPAPAAPDWDAKDRRIAMESAYHSAAIIFTGAWTQAADDEGWTEFKKRFNGLAVAIYQGVQKAGRGEL